MERSFHGLIELTEEHCRELLEEHRPPVGRIAFVEDRDPHWPTILPINYSHAGDSIYFRTFEGSKLFAALRRQRLAFEIDGLDEDLGYGWSVVVIGTPEVVTGDAPDDVGVLRSWASDKPEHLVRLAITQITGREVMGPDSG